MRSLGERLRAPAMFVALTALGACGGEGGGGGGTPPPTPIAIRLVPVASGLQAPVYLTHAGDASGRLFVLEQPGRIRVIDASGTLLPTPYLDLAGLVVAVDPSFDERGVLGLAFHPSFETNGRLFVNYSAPRVGVPGDTCSGEPRGCNSAVVSEFTVVGDPTTTNVVDPATERVLLSVDKPQWNHNGGQITFGPDGYLYVGLGDGGGAHDGLADSPPSHGPIGNGQDRDALLGKILRLDVDSAPAAGLEYAIPPTNPFVGMTGADEVFAYGFRNPYRFSFDDRPGGGGALLVADVGQNLYEELDVVVAGGNYGWALHEGPVCFDPFNPDNPPATCAATGFDGSLLLGPVLAYAHSVGLAIVGGYVYRGSAFPQLVGQYVFGDWSDNFGPNGQLWYAPIAGPHAFVRTELTLPGNAPLGLFVLGIGQDESGELYVTTSDSVNPLATNGAVFRIAAP
jgi:glucose/arabinose dehydrogenase